MKNLLGAGDASAVYGVPGCGKSVLVEDIALHVAAGIDWHGRAVKQGAVLFIALERKKLVERRAIAFRERHAIHNIPFALMGGMFDLRTSHATAAIVETARQVEGETGHGLALIVIDTISRALCGGDENSPKDMGAIVAATSMLQIDTKAHILWVHHMPQDGAERLRGHGALLGAMDTTVHVAKAGALRIATVIKANDAEEGESIAFTLEGVTIGPETTAPVVVPAENAAHIAVGRRTRSALPKADIGCCPHFHVHFWGRAEGAIALATGVPLTANLRGVTDAVSWTYCWGPRGGIPSTASCRNGGVTDVASRMSATRIAVPLILPGSIR